MPARKTAESARSKPKTGSVVKAETVRQEMRQRGNPLLNLTAQRIANDLDGFERGYYWSAALLWDKVKRRDAMLASVTAKREGSVSRYPWEIVALERSPVAERQKEALTYFLNNLVSTRADRGGYCRGWGGAVRGILNCLGPGFAVTELIWRPTPSGLSAELKYVPQWYFDGSEGDGQIRYQPLMRGGGGGVDLQPGEWLTACHEFPLMEASLIASYIKSEGLKDWALFSERFAIPGVKGKTNAEQGSPEWEAMKDAVENFGSDWAAVIGEGGEIDIIQINGGTSNIPMPGLIGKMEQLQAIIWRGSDMGTARSDKSHQYGASLQGDEAAIFLEDDAEMVADTVNMQILPWVLKYALGESDAPSVALKIVLPRRHDAKAEIEVDRFLIGAGVRLSTIGLAERYGRPTADEGEEIANEPPKPAAPNPNPAALPALPPPGDEGEGIDEEALANEALPGELERFEDAALANASRAMRDGFQPAAAMIQRALRSLENGNAEAGRETLAALSREIAESPWSVARPAPLERSFESALAAAYAVGLGEVRDLPAAA